MKVKIAATNEVTASSRKNRLNQSVSTFEQSRRWQVAVHSLGLKVADDGTMP
jgi:predicted transcriptional regulator